MGRKISVISFTQQGRKLAYQIKDALLDREVEIYQKPKQGLSLWAKEQFAEKNALIFIGACAIAVRTIAPYVRDKLSDPPVLVLDEKGEYVIPLLSGHVGGANELAELLAKKTGAKAVITTATDINGKFAVDLFAKENNLEILNREGIAKVSAKVLRGETITVSIEQDGESPAPQESAGENTTALKCVPYPPKQRVDILVSPSADDESAAKKALLRLKPKEYILGVGCRKGKTQEELSGFILKTLQKIGIGILDIAFIASIDRKKEEEGICGWAKRHDIPFVVFPEETLRGTEGDFSGSAFVERTVGVDNVCERAAMAACGEGGKLILGKQAENGMTLAVAKRKQKIRWEW